MADPVSVVAGSAASQIFGGERLRQQQPAGGRSFESVMQRQAGDAQQQQQPVTPERTVSGAQLERMRLDLTERIKRLPPGLRNVKALLPELLDSRTRLGMLRDVMSKSHGTPAGTDLRGRFGQVENEWYQVESVMRSNKELSTTELLGLQARLYQVTQHVEVLSKVVDQVTGGIKTILRTNRLNSMSVITTGFCAPGGSSAISRLIASSMSCAIAGSSRYTYKVSRPSVWRNEM